MKREIFVELIGKTERTPGMAKWLKHVGAPDEFIDTLPDGGAAIVGSAAKRCYMAFEPGLNPNVTKVRKDWTDYFDNILSSGHGSVLEHTFYNFGIEGVTRVFTGEMNRHRAGVAISEGSMRYIRFEDEVPYWEPHSIQGDDEKHAITRDLFRSAFLNARRTMQQLAEIWDIENVPFSQKKKLTSMFRRLIPMGVSTGGVWSMNPRALRHVFALRTSPHAEEEIAYVAGEMAKLMVEAEPLMFGDFERDESTGAWVPRYPKV